MYCWEEGLTLPTVDNCPECNGFCREDRSYKKPHFDQRPRGPIIRERGDDRRVLVHCRLGDRVSVHDRLGGRTMLRDPAGGRVSADERVEQAATAQVSDEYPHSRDPERELVHDNVDRPRWCPRGLTRSQKRRVQRLRQIETVEEEERKEVPRRRVRSEVWRVKPKADEGQQSGSSAAPINMVFMLPSEFMAPDDDDEEQDLEEAMAQLNFGTYTGYF